MKSVFAMFKNLFGKTKKHRSVKKKNQRKRTSKRRVLKQRGG